MKSVVWDITSICNLKCIHCYNFDKYFKKTNQDLSIEKIFSLINFLEKNKVEHVYLLGGEPLAHPNFMDILTSFYNHNIKVTITTNATLLTKEVSNEICKFDMLSEMIVSIDGGTQEINDSIRGIGTYKKAIDNVFQFNDCQKKYHSNTKITVSHCIMPFNDFLDDIKIIDVCNQINACGISISPAINSGKASHDFKKYHDSLNKIYDQIEKIIAYANKIYPELDIQLEMRPIVAQYFNYKFKSRVVCPHGHASCLAFTKELYYIKSDGTFLPCGLVEFPIGLKEQEKNHFNIKDAYIYDGNTKDFDYIDHSKLFLDFFKTFNLYSFNKDSQHCENCDFYSVCEPCPFQNNNGEILEDCNIIFPKYLNIRNKSKNWIITKVDNISINDPNLSYLLDKFKTPISLKNLYCLYSSEFPVKYDYFFNLIKELEHRFIVTIERI